MYTTYFVKKMGPACRIYHVSNFVGPDPSSFSDCTIFALRSLPLSKTELTKKKEFFKSVHPFRRRSKIVKQRQCNRKKTMGLDPRNLIHDKFCKRGPFFTKYVVYMQYILSYNQKLGFHQRICILSEQQNARAVQSYAQHMSG